MHRAKEYLHTEISRALRRYRRGIWLRGSALVLLGLSLPLAVLFLLRNAWEAMPWLVPAVSAMALAAALFAAIRWLVLPLRRRITANMIARTVELKHPALEDRLATAVDQLGPREDAWLIRLLDDAVRHLGELKLEQDFRLRGGALWRVLLVAALATMAFLILQRGTWQGRLSEIAQSGFASPRPIPELQVLPGDVAIRKGGEVNVRALLKNSLATAAMLYFTSADSGWTAAPMSTGNGPAEFSYQLFDVTDTLRYYVRVDDEISKIYHVDLYDAPELRRIELTYLYPGDAGLPTKHESDGGDIWAPAGTRVQMKAISSTALKGAELLVGEDQQAAMQILNDTTAAGQLQITGDGFYRIRLVSRRGLDNSPLIEYYIHALQNTPPAVTLRKPAPELKATMLEEVPVIAEVSDDFGLQRVELGITVNDSTEMIFPMRASTTGQKGTEDITYTTEDFEAQINLEELGVRPGDFLTYVVRAVDAGQSSPTLSDMFFIEVANFENIYTLGASQQGAPGGGNQTSLAMLQKDIILATSRILRKSQSLPRGELESDVEALGKSQANVRETAERIVSSMSMGFNRSREATEVKVEMEKAIIVMKQAENAIARDSLRLALSPERRAYNHLLRADSYVRERQISLSQSAAANSAQRAEALRRLFDEEIDKLQSKYETLQQGDRQQTQKLVDDAIKRIQELARRQEHLNEVNRDLANKEMSLEQKKREIQKLQRQQEQLRQDTQREMEQLARNLQNEQNSARQATQKLQRAANDMREATQSLRQDSPENAAASGQQALNQLSQLEDRLRKNQANAAKENLQQMQQQVDRLAEAQNRLAQESKELSQKRGADEQALAEKMEAQHQLRQEFDRTMQSLQQLGREARENEDLQRELQSAHREMMRNQIEQKMEQSETALALGRPDQAQHLQERAGKALQEGAEKLSRAAAALGDANQQNLESAMQEAQRLRQQLEDQMAAGEGKKSAQPQQSPSQQRRPDQSGNPATGNQSLTNEQLQNWRELLWDTERKLQELEQNAFSEDQGLVDRSRNIRNIISGIVRNFRGGEQLRLEVIKNQLVDPLLRLEAELATRMELNRSEQGLRSVREAEIPIKYREFIEEYYRSLNRDNK